MIYKRYELSQSLNGDRIVYIARDASGVVRFRETSEGRLKKAIDKAILARQLEEEAAKKRKEALAKKRKEEEQEQKSAVQEMSEETEGAENPEEEILVPPQARVTRGPDGKFISKSQLVQTEPPKKKSFWDRLR